ncbi:putative periplasmic protein kinase ArgK and related GTPases of G3E family [Acidisarcina polymorpha]|uniref:Putative periplasmic protein kinase ArgK and related GTPases of G3E family n=1 Tax=Acidisarcina polymorpha TaxID=2211140 RepID=A0A2Z5G6V1_9BACT|nr:methylmalonyl Co-A mutase-associated GTPase MeaB [Acidisarcina polymorpha]AXC14821.1 putative periplasmic protein kinase ArgK and related GTPases of G3E family [Acidisarcina polymorpha]
MTDAIEELIEQLRGGSVRALSRAISEVENGGSLAPKILAGCFPYSGRALRVGITGSPGAGKSTLVDHLVTQYRSQGRTVGVVAVDPTSPYSGGAILGDRIRMQAHHADSGVFTRSMATRGALGGLASTTADVVSIIEASGKDVILIETVGVGQDEIDVVRLADVCVVAVVPGMGDDIQSMKAGIMEIADVLVINKSDREGSDRLEQELRAMQSLGHSSKEPNLDVHIIRTVAITGDGIAELQSAIGAQEQWLGMEGRLFARRSAQWRERISNMIRQEVLRNIQRPGGGEDEFAKLAEAAAAGTVNPYLALPRMMERLRQAARN